MKAIILVAGQGKRISAFNDKPKCLLKVAGISILENALKCLEHEGFQEVVLVVGYKAGLIRSLGDSFNNMKLTYIDSPLYKTTNNMFSLYLAHRYLSRGAIVMDGDNFFEQQVLNRVLEGREDCWAAVPYQNLEGAMLTVDSTGRIVKVESVTEVSTFPDRYRFVGIMKLSSELGVKLARWLSEDVAKGDTNIFYERVLGRRLAEHPIYICSVDGLKWVEVDTEEDYRQAQTLFR